jgi:two-component system chemotaxis response regulator CheY
VNIKVLVADDSGTMRKIIIRALNSLGINDVTEAADGAEAVAKFVPGQFQVVLTDWNMPHMTGVEVARAIRQQDADVKIIMVTTEAERSRVLEAIQAGVSDYLTKPFTPDSLLAKIDKHCTQTV